jgi:putative colanic acid biosynthesis glycosyltransferase
VSARLRPIVSIVTVVRNGGKTIGSTLESVQKQDLVDIEHVIVDGASFDGTVDLIKTSQHDKLRWISEPDLGIYDAMNKGLAMARGEWILFLGADDVFADTSVLSDIFSMRELQNYDLICGRSTYRNGRSCVPRLDWHTLVFNTLHHQAVFYNRRLFSNFKYRTDIPVVADYELNLYAYINRLPVLFLDRQISISDPFGVSHTSGRFSNGLDSYRIRRRYIGHLLNAALLVLAISDMFSVWLMQKISMLRPFNH